MSNADTSANTDAKEAPLLKDNGVSVYLRAAGQSQYYSVGERGDWLRVPTKWMGQEIKPEEAIALYNGMEVIKTGHSSGKEFFICGGAQREGSYPSKQKPGETVSFKELVLSQVFPKLDKAGELFGYSVAVHGKPGADGKFPETQYVDFYRYYGKREKPIGELLPTDCARLLNGLSVFPNEGLELKLGEVKNNERGFPTAFVKFNFIRDAIDQGASEAQEEEEQQTQNHGMKR